jgi:hypothetical protein
MKKYLLALLLLLPLSASATEVISWTASPSADVTGYKVYWSPDPNAAKPWPVLAAVTGLVYTNTVTGRFAYYITATNACCESDPSPVAMRPGNPDNPKVR